MKQGATSGEYSTNSGGPEMKKLLSGVDYEGETWYSKVKKANEARRMGQEILKDHPPMYEKLHPWL